MVEKKTTASTKRSRLIKPKELEAILKVCRKHGVMQLRSEGLELYLDTSPTPAKLTTVEAAQISPTQATSPMPTEEDLMYWSSSQP